jgi:hypothetical protein
MAVESAQCCGLSSSYRPSALATAWDALHIRKCNSYLNRNRERYGAISPLRRHG